MIEDKRATFSKVRIGDGGDAKTIYSFRLEKFQLVFAILASIASIIVALVVLWGAVYASVQDVAAEEFSRQLETFHTEVQPAIRKLIDERVEAAAVPYVAAGATRDHRAEIRHTTALASLSVVLGRMDERLEGIEKRLDRMELKIE